MRLEILFHLHSAGIGTDKKTQLILVTATLSYPQWTPFFRRSRKNNLGPANFALVSLHAFLFGIRFIFMPPIRRP